MIPSPVVSMIFWCHTTRDFLCCKYCIPYPVLLNLHSQHIVKSCIIYYAYTYTHQPCKHQLMFSGINGMMVYNNCAMYAVLIRNLLLYETQGAADVGPTIIWVRIYPESCTANSHSQYIVNNCYLISHNLRFFQFGWNK